MSALQVLHHFRLNPDRSSLPLKLSKEMVDQKRNVGNALSQGRDGNRDDTQPIIEVFSEISPGDLFFKISIGRRNDSNIHFDRPAIPDPFEFFIFDDP
jgi:hypothetical protein